MRFKILGVSFYASTFALPKSVPFSPLHIRGNRDLSVALKLLVYTNPQKRSHSPPGLGPRGRRVLQPDTRHPNGVDTLLALSAQKGLSLYVCPCRQTLLSFCGYLIFTINMHPSKLFQLNFSSNNVNVLHVLSSWSVFWKHGIWSKSASIHLASSLCLVTGLGLRWGTFWVIGKLKSVNKNYYRKNLSPTHGTKSVDKEDAIEVSLLRNAFGCLWNKEGVFFVRKRLIRTFTF